MPYTIQLGSTATSTSTFTNRTSITIPATRTGAATGAPAHPYPSNVIVSGVVGTMDVNFQITIRNDQPPPEILSPPRWYYSVPDSPGLRLTDDGEVDDVLEDKSSKQ